MGDNFNMIYLYTGAWKENRFIRTVDPPKTLFDSLQIEMTFCPIQNILLDPLLVDNPLLVEYPLLVLLMIFHLQSKVAEMFHICKVTQSNERTKRLHSTAR